MRLLASRDVPIDAGEMFWSIVWVTLPRWSQGS
jgi:hypothetical protein